MESIELTIDYYNNEHAYSENYRRNVTLLFSGLLTKLKEVRLPELADRWKHYSYELAGDSLILSLCEAEDIELDNDGYIDSMSTINEHVLIVIEASYLTNSEFAKTHEVTVATVNKWIKRGKLKMQNFLRVSG